jgi:TetR/AcrR family transcriptional regulator, transcriptional repressor of bet genes
VCTITRKGCTVPKVVDHDERRDRLGTEAIRLVARGGIDGLTFRALASAAGVSVNQIQHYFGSKEGLVAHTLRLTSREMASRIEQRLASSRARSGREQAIVVLRAFIPDDATSRELMSVYHAFAAAGVTDARLRGDEYFEAGRGLKNFLAEQLADGASPHVEALASISVVLGLSLSVLLDQIEVDEAEAALELTVRRGSRRAPKRKRSARFPTE